MKPSASRLNSCCSGSTHASQAALFGSGLRWIAAVLMQQVEKDGFDFGVGQPALRPLFAPGVDLVGLRRAFKVAKEAGVVGGAHALAALGNEADQRHVAGFERAPGSRGCRRGFRRMPARSRCVPTILDEVFDRLVELSKSRSVAGRGSKKTRLWAGGRATAGTR